jgi:hypothetical protein
VIQVHIPIKTQKILLPLKSIEIVGTNKWIIRLLENEKIVEKEVLLWKLYTQNVEFISFSDNTKLSSNMKLITSDVSNFDETKFTLKIKN